MAICDDHRGNASELEDGLRRILDDRGGVSAEIDLYETGEGLLRAIDRAPYPVVFLDMEMPGKSGLDIAEIIRLSDRQALLIFVTGHAEYMRRSFEVQPFRYLLKPVDSDELKLAVLGVVDELRRRQSWISFSYKQTVSHVRTDEIVHVTVERGKKLVVFTPGGTHRYYGRLGELEEKLVPFGFCRIHTGYVVNWRHVRAVSKDSVSLDNGTRLPMSRGRSEAALLSYHRYIETRLLR